MLPCVHETPSLYYSIAPHVALLKIFSQDLLYYDAYGKLPSDRSLGTWTVELKRVFILSFL